MVTSERGRAFIARWEGRRLKPYADSAGRLTIGVGHLLTAEEIDSGALRIGDRVVLWARGISEADADALLARDLASAERGVSSSLSAPVTQEQFDALVSFTFNVGTAALRRSGVLRAVNAGRVRDVPRELSHWVNAGGKRIQGLVNRRAAEGRLWIGGDYGDEAEG